MEENDYGLYMDEPGDESAMIFYPGAKVEYTVYVPLLYQLAEKGVDVFLIKMPCNLAFLGQNKAEDVMGEYEYEKWYLEDHSLGGAIYAQFGNYGVQKGDGAASISREEQQNQTVEAVYKMIRDDVE